MNAEDLYWFTFTLVTIVGYFTFKLITRHKHFFTARGVPFVKPHFIYGNLNDVLSGKVSTLELVQQFYQKFENERIFGFYNYLSPVFYVRDPDLIEKLWVQEGNHFANHGYFLDERKDAILGNQLHLLKDEKWHRMRCSLGPVFSSKQVAPMTRLIQTNSADLIDHLKGRVDSELEFKGVFVQHAFNVIASCAFGLELNTFKDESDQFCQIGGALVYGNNPVQTLKTMLFYLFPKLMSKMNVQLMEASHAKYFMNLLRATIEERDQYNVNRPDMIHLLNRANKRELELNAEDRAYFQIKDSSRWKMTNQEFVAQCVTFFGPSFENLVNLISFASYELAANPDVQLKLFAEIQNTSKETPLSYDSINGMIYLDMVISETLRKWPAAPSCDRECSKDYRLNQQDGLSIQFRKGDSLWVSVWALHRDERYFPDPERFDPERFSEAKRGEIRPNTYLPFGVGQRNCIGRRLALLVAKLTLVDLVRNFQLSLGSKLVQPFRLAKASFSLEPEGGFWLQIAPRL
ncbi:cytochrome P450 9b2-like [Topomyia yanbarensis]|uniref:cytochrome P450 9b2-like n=1 Tax=Topomyia yanbarensis TaxID=2498891 RepID=UPI00273BBDAC|nr:cytochrome P450 9b2-like [Topomyia yanbarensis]